MPRPALFLDRDGVVNEDVGYLHRIEDCRFLDGVFALAAAFAKRGFLLVIATNQSGIGRGFYTPAQFERLMSWIGGEFARRGLAVAAVYHCPDHPTEGLGPYRRESPLRKPAPGMFLKAARDLDLDLARSWSIGDKLTDVAAARAAGVGRLVLLDAGLGNSQAQRTTDYWRLGTLGEVVRLLEAEQASLEAEQASRAVTPAPAAPRR